MTRTAAQTAVASMSDTDLKTLADAAVLAYVAIVQYGRGNLHPNITALADSVRELVGGGEDITG